MAGGLAAQAPSGAGVREVTGALVGLRRSLARNSPGGSGTVVGLRVLGLALGVGTLLCGLVRFDDPGRMVDLLATLGSRFHLDTGDEEIRPTVGLTLQPDRDVLAVTRPVPAPAR